MRIYFLLLVFILNAFALQKDEIVFLENFMKGELSQQHQVEDRKCGMRYSLMIQRYHEQLDPALYQAYVQHVELDTARQRSTLSLSGYFRLHWNESGKHAVPLEDQDSNGIPDYIDKAAVILDSVRVVEVELMGYQAPPGPDGTPAVPYHIYFSSIPYYGITWPVDPDIPQLPGANYPSYIELHKNYVGYPTSDIDGLKVTAAHEFHHAIQFGYNVNPDDYFFYEMTSTWMEEVLYPNVNDYLYYLDEFFDTVSNTRFNSFEGYYPYANSLYLHMLESQYGRSIVRSIWDQIKQASGRNPYAMPAIRSVLKAYNTSWLESLAEYGLWLYYTGDRVLADQFFKDAPYFPMVSVKVADIFEFSESLNIDVMNSMISNRYLEIYPVQGKILSIDGIAGGVSETGFRPLTRHSYSIFHPLPQQITGEPVDTDTLTLILTNSGNDYVDFIINLSLTGTVDITSVFPFPNPVNLSNTNTARFRNVPPEADLYIYNTLGQRVARIDSDGGGTIRYWSLKNESGQKVAAGVYLFLVNGEGLSEIGKFSIIR